jgi:hypothetical protein
MQQATGGERDESLVKIGSKSISAFARDHGLCEQSVYNAINRGQLKARKFGRRTLIAAEDERAFLDSLPTIKPRLGAA